MTVEDREDIRFIVAEEMHRHAQTSSRVDRCCSRIEDLVERMLDRKRNPSVAEKMVEDYRRLIQVAA